MKANTEKIIKTIEIIPIIGLIIGVLLMIIPDTILLGIIVISLCFPILLAIMMIQDALFSKK